MRELEQQCTLYKLQ